MQLVEQGKVALETPIGRYIPDYPNRDAKELVTVHQLLTHTSGIGDFFNEKYMARKKELRSVTDLLALFDRHDYNAFPVVGPEGGLVGIVSKLDVLRLFVGAATASRGLEENVCAADVMQRKVVSIRAEDTIVQAGTLMVATNLRSLPVAHGGDAGATLVGMLSRGDVLRGLRFQLEGGR